MDDLKTGVDGAIRCAWCVGDPEYQRYHDEEWGRPVNDTTRLFEKICLEGFQAGLSWLTILKRRERLRDCFHRFDFHRVAKMTEADVQRLLSDATIIRHRGKIEATIHNASRAIDMERRPGGLKSFLWQFQPSRSTSYERFADVPAITPESKAMSRELKRAGWKFVGPTTCYALMQAMGMVNDHLVGCDWHSQMRQPRGASNT
ncbi:MAG: DNA-3-methyladenine glycosylase I [Planctomycetota bacterium]